MKITNKGQNRIYEVVNDNDEFEPRKAVVVSSPKFIQVQVEQDGFDAYVNLTPSEAIKLSQMLGWAAERTDENANQ